MRSPSDPPDIEHFRVDGQAPILLLCDHAGKRVPERLHGLGIGEEMLGRHIGWDIGAADMTRRLATLLDAPAILCHVSRLVIDPNRRPKTPSSIPDISDGCVIPANELLSPEEADRRIREHFLPYHHAVARRIGAFRRAGIVPVVIAMHSFTPHMSGEDRPWQIGVLWRGDTRLSAPALEGLRARGDLVVGDNQPYSGIADFGFTVTFHAQRPRLPHVMLEVRQDEIDTLERAEAYAGLIHAVLRPALDDPALYRLHDGHNLAGTGRPLAWRLASIIPPRP